jgi:hypothetical protein
MSSQSIPRQRPRIDDPIIGKLLVFINIQYMLNPLSPPLAVHPNAILCAVSITYYPLLPNSSFHLSNASRPSRLTLGRIFRKLITKSSNPIGRISSRLVIKRASPSERSGPIAASFASAVISDPEKPDQQVFSRGVPSVNSTNSTSSVSESVCNCFRNNDNNCTNLVSAAGNGIYCLSTNLLRAASSINHGILVAASTSTRGLEVSFPAAAEARLLHWMRNSVFRRREASLSEDDSLDREERRESISSTKIILGDKAFARSNNARTNFSDSPSWS